jgi:hypothetical protein
VPEQRLAIIVEKARLGCGKRPALLWWRSSAAQRYPSKIRRRQSSPRKKKGNDQRIPLSDIIEIGICKHGMIMTAYLNTFLLDKIVSL